MLPRLAFPVLCLALAVSGNEETCVTQESTSSPWISRLVMEAMVDYVPFGVSDDSNCTRHGQLYAEHLSNLTFWATKMYESSSLGVVPGILLGKNVDYGHFDECVSVRNERHGIAGQYMVVRVQFAPGVKKDPHFQEIPEVYVVPESEDVAWAALRPSNDWRVPDMNVIQWSVCVPASCSEEDIQQSLVKKLLPCLQSQQLTANLSILSDYTYSRANHQPNISFSYYIFLSVGMVLLMMVVHSSLQDMHHSRNKDLKPTWFSSFSIFRNFDDIFSVKDNEFAVISGLKAYSMCLIIFGHRLFFGRMYLQQNPLDSELATGTLSSTIVDNGSLVVNAFMVITGFLTFYKITKTVANNQDLYPWRNIFSRWMRLTPAYLATMAIMYYGFQFIEGGPMTRVSWDINVFPEYWWTHLLYINNYVHVDKQILIPSWYMAYDFQMYAFSYILASLLRPVWKRTLPILSLIAAISLAIPAIIITFKGYYGTFRIPFTSLVGFIRSPEFRDMYVPAHARASTYIIGMIGGYLYYHAKESGFRFNMVMHWMLAAFITISLPTCYYGAWVFFIPGRQYVLSENIAYVVLHRLFYSVSIVVIIFLTTMGRNKVLKNFLSAKPFEALNKLNYSTLLIHSVLQQYLMGFERAPANFGRMMNVWMACGDILMSYFLSVFLYALVEGPFSRLQSYIPALKILSRRYDSIQQK